MYHVAAVLGGSLLWGLAWWPIRVLDAHGLGGAALTLVVYGTPALLLLPLTWRLRAQWLAKWHMLFGIFILGGVWNLAYMMAVIHGHAGRVVLLCYLSSAWSIVGGKLFLREGIGARRWLCVVLALAGAWMIVGGAAVGGSHIDPIDLLAVICGIAHASTNLLFRRVEDIPVVSKNAATFLGAVCAAGIGLFGAGAGESNAAPMVWMAAAVFGMLWVLSAESLTQFGVSHLPVARSSILLIAELPITVVSAALIANEHLRALEMLGGSLILMATVIEILRRDPIHDHLTDVELGAA